MPFWKPMALLLMPLLAACAQAQSPVPMETASAASTPAHQTFTVASAALNETRVVNVYLPPGFDPSGQAGYPTLYMPDGGMKEDFPHVASALDDAIRAGTVRPMLLVGVENTQRRRDMTPPTRVASDREIAAEVGGSAAFRAFFADELIPQVEARYRVGPSRGIIGESLAGLFVMETLFAQPGLFDTHIALSPSLWWDDASLVAGAQAQLQGAGPPQGRLFLTAADETNILPHVQALASLLTTDAPAGLYATVKPRPDLDHSTIYRALAPELLVSYYPSVTPQDAAPMNRPQQPVSE